MAEFNLNYYNTTDFYSDGDIENDILNIVENKIIITENNSKSYPYPVAYHLLKERENILIWYPFKNNSTCLEIGAGCGAITGLLCRKNKKVVSVDISKRRCEINYKRNINYNNLEIIAGNFQEIELNEKFDYVILNGVYEYALSFFHTSENPYIEFLKLIKKFLKKDSKILIAIENRLGLKYFNGAAEDHTDNYFLGLNNYNGNNSVRTFSKSELIDIINKSGYKHYKFYYPYPDYKFPTEIFSDDTINNYNYGNPYINLNKRNFGLYSEQKVAKSLSDEKIIDSFANSFLIEISNFKNMSNIVYAKINSLRKEKYQIMTVIKKEHNTKFVYKMPLNKTAEAHLSKMYINSKNNYLPNINNIEAKPFKNGLKYDFIKEKNIYTIISEYTDMRSPNKIKEILTDFFQKLIDVSEEKDFGGNKFENVFGSCKYHKKLKCISNANIDLICDNIFYSDTSTYTIIDNEWIFDFDIPVQFIIWRCINELYYKNTKIDSIISQKSIFGLFKIDSDMEKAFRSWAVYFADKYVGDNYLLNYSCPVNEISLLDIYNKKESDKTLPSSCYCDMGDGYSEKNKSFATVKLDDSGCFEVDFEIPGNCINLRWDITENKYLKCKIDSIISDGNEITYKADNSEYSDNGFDVFYTADPHYTIYNYGSKITIKGKIQFITYGEVLAFKNHKLEIKNNELENTYKQIESINTEFEKAKSEYYKILSIKNRYISYCENRLMEYNANITAVNSMIEEYERKVKAYENFMSSRTGRLINRLYTIKNKIKNFIQ